MHHCGGSLITSRHVLTAGHCLSSYDKKQFRLRFADKKKYRIKGLHVHKKYNKSTYNNDIAIIELEQPVPLDGLVKTVCLPDALRFHYIGMTGVAIGWGRIAEGEPTSKKLRKVDLPILSETECEESNYPKGRFTNNMFCAGYMEGQRDSCNGDSGGALHVRNQLGAMEVVGLVSFGRGCARPKFPGVYTKVTNYMNWIADHIKGECICSMPKDIIQSFV
uniref:limulus clotting factor C n=1 Tax=Trichogramma kaykai TaxID=54128 RepID=A0ABD2W6E8_9HYME